MNHSPLESVSVVIVNYNAGEQLVDSVRAALGQATQVIVVDNDSIDSSMEMLKAWFPNEPRLLLHFVGRNLGFAGGCNRGLGLSSEPHVLFLNPDCIMGEGVLNCLVQVLKGNPAVGMVGGFLLDPDGTEQAGGRRAIPTPWRSFVRAFGLVRFARRWPRLFFDFHLHKQPLPKEPMDVEAISGACMLVKREALEDVGSWDEKYFLHCEDLDLCMRFRRKGWKILFVPDAPVMHHHGVCGKSRPVFVEWHKHRGMIRFYRKFFRHQYPGVLMLLVVFGVWLRFGAVAVYHTVQRARGKNGG